jgi:hypothetical protein
MKLKLIAALSTNPTLAAKGGDFLDDLADDLLAVVIQSLTNTTADDATARQEFNDAVHNLYVSPFGVQMHNALFSCNPDNFNSLDVATRKRIEVAMLQTFLLENGAAQVFAQLPGDILKARLKFLAN